MASGIKRSRGCRRVRRERTRRFGASRSAFGKDPEDRPRKPQKPEKPRLHARYFRSRENGGKRLLTRRVHSQPHKGVADTRRCGGRRQDAAEIHLFLPQAYRGPDGKSI